MAIPSNSGIRAALAAVGERLPAGWSIRPAAARARVARDGHAIIASPDAQSALLTFEVRSRLDPRGVLVLADRVRERSSPENLVVVAPFLSPSTRARLRDAGIAFVDLTGNILISLSRPGLYIEARGADEDPAPTARPVRSLRGPKAGRIVRALVDHRAVPGVRVLAAMAEVDAGYVSRLLAFLDSEGLVDKEMAAPDGRQMQVAKKRARLHSVDWVALVRRWATDAPLDSRAVMSTWIEPRGLSMLDKRLRDSRLPIAVTGSAAAARYSAAAPPRLAQIYARDPERIAAQLRLRPAESGANVVLLEPVDDVVFTRTVTEDDIRYVAPSQAAADLLTSPGRGPAEADELIEWMRMHEEDWRG